MHNIKRKESKNDPLFSAAPKKEMTMEQMIDNYKLISDQMQIKSKMGKFVKTHCIKLVKKEIARLFTKKNQDKNSNKKHFFTKKNVENVNNNN